MRQQILTKFITIRHILKHFVVGDVSGDILKTYIDLLLEGSNWYELYTWFAEIRFLGLDSDHKFSCDNYYNMTGYSPRNIVSINISTLIHSIKDLADILENNSQPFKIFMYITVSTMNEWHFKLQFYKYILPTVLSISDVWYNHDIKKIEEVFNYIKDQTII